MFATNEILRITAAVSFLQEIFPKMRLKPYRYGTGKKICALTFYQLSILRIINMVTTASLEMTYSAIQTFNFRINTLLKYEET
jgi:hypothetical protein